MKTILSLPGVHFLASRYGPSALRAAAFNAKFQSGDWGCDGESAELARLIEEYSAGGSILSLGCGSNQIGALLNPNAYRSFLGVDLSEEALRRARATVNFKTRFIRGDLESFDDWQQRDVILFPESLYYVPLHRARHLLFELSGRLTPSGRMIATFADPQRYAGYLKLIDSMFHVYESRPLSATSPRQVIVF